MSKSYFICSSTTLYKEAHKLSFQIPFYYYLHENKKSAYFSKIISDTESSFKDEWNRPIRRPIKKINEEDDRIIICYFYMKRCICEIIKYHKNLTDISLKITLFNNNCKIKSIIEFKYFSNKTSKINAMKFVVNANSFSYERLF